MSYVIYKQDTTAIVEVVRRRPYRRTTSYKTLPAAKAALTRMHKKFIDKHGIDAVEDGPLYNYGIAEEGHYRARIEKMVERVNMMTGKKYMESVNTPAYCSPASESYWSM
jgi:hypothetical protein